MDCSAHALFTEVTVVTGSFKVAWIICIAFHLRFMTHMFRFMKHLKHFGYRHGMNWIISIFYQIL